MNLDRIAPLLGLLVTSALLQAGVGAAAPTETDQCLQAGDTPVHMKTRDGVTIYGLEVGTGTTGVVFGHQYFSDHCEFMALARELAGLGYRAVSIDFRGNGLSSTGRSNRLDLDIAAAVARLRAEGATRVKLVGASMGGTAALVAARGSGQPWTGSSAFRGRTTSAASTLFARSSARRSRFVSSSRATTGRSPRTRPS